MGGLRMVGLLPWLAIGMQASSPAMARSSGASPPEIRIEPGPRPRVWKLVNRSGLTLVPHRDRAFFGVLERIDSEDRAHPLFYGRCGSYEAQAPLPPGGELEIGEPHSIFYPAPLNPGSFRVVVRVGEQGGSRGWVVATYFQVIGLDDAEAERLATSVRRAEENACPDLADAMAFRLTQAVPAETFRRLLPIPTPEVAIGAWPPEVPAMILARLAAAGSDDEILALSVAVRQGGRRAFGRRTDAVIRHLGHAAYRVRAEDTRAAVRANLRAARLAARPVGVGKGVVGIYGDLRLRADNLPAECRSLLEQVRPLFRPASPRTIGAWPRLDWRHGVSSVDAM